MHFVIFSGGTLTNGKAIKKALAQFDKVIAVDSGASHCSEFNLIPDFLVGDFDSINKSLLKKFEKSGSKIFRFASEKDQTDTELAIDLAIMQGATSISILGGVTGDRIDHVLGNILLLMKKKYANLQIQFVSGDQEIFLARNEVKISGNTGDTISLIPISGPVKNLSSTGLKYNLTNYQLSIQGNHGISNKLTSKTAKVIFKNKTLLIIHSLSK